MCNLYSITKGQQAIREFTRAHTATIHFANHTEAHTIAGYASGDVISFDGYGANASLTHEVGSTAYECRAAGANGYDTLHLPGVTNLASIHHVFA
jgi:hypothetical protein